jgi:hypothetical protein
MTLAEWQAFRPTQDVNSTCNTNPWTTEQSQFVYNETAVEKMIPLTGAWQTLPGTNHSGTITLQPYTSEILISQ